MFEVVEANSSSSSSVELEPISEFTDATWKAVILVLSIVLPFGVVEV